MRGWYFFIVLLWLPFMVKAQSGTITGKILNSGSKTPVARASVFLSNATYGTSSADDGSFTLRGIKPGQYDLIVSYVGFEEFSQKVLVTNNTASLNIELVPKVMMMHQVTIISNADWKKNYEQFKKDFIGTTENAKHCTVLNPRVLDLIYYRKRQTLEASADEFLVVVNNALGYKTKFLLNSFSSDAITHTISYSGRALFEDLPGTAEQKMKWKLKREESYYGSPQHFYRSLYKNTLANDSFVIYDFKRVLNPHRAQEDLIQRKLRQFNGLNRDSVNYWNAQENTSRWANESLAKPPLTAYDILRRTPQEGIYALTFPHYLYVVYTKKHEEFDFKDLYRPLDMENFETSVITLYKQYVVFDQNGIVVADSPLYEGTWSKAKLANLLPVDYEPGN